MDRFDRIADAEGYLRSRTGNYGYRCFRYRAAIDAMRHMGLDDDCLVFDIGAGWTELDACLRTEYGFRGRYVPVDAMIDGVDLDEWVPPRKADFFVALELLEHLENPVRLASLMRQNCTRGLVVSVPNPEKTDVLGMDPTHRTVVDRQMLVEQMHMTRVEPRSFYGQPGDSLFAYWAHPEGLIRTMATRAVLDLPPLHHETREVA